MKLIQLVTSVALIGSMTLGAYGSANAADVTVKITPKMAAAKVKHDGKTITVMRNQNQENTINPDFAKTSRKCPPFCIRPFNTAKGVETIGELEVIEYAKQMSDGKKVMLVDNRTPDWHAKGTIPGAVNVPFTRINRSKGADDLSFAEALELFGATEGAKGWDFSKAKTLVMFCNGMWCGQSPLGIEGIMDLGYPADKIKWYRGGMQSWEIVGLTTVKP
ncbi:MAG: rhodanese-like domain-containing protein [Chromatiales bacterium]|nr:rhodanese-like domain-containing protein [Chromatiales bacterium]